MAAWQRKSLSELFRVGSSKRVLQSQWQSEGVPFYRGREITLLSTDGFVKNALFISEDLFAELATKNGVPNAGDIMITAIATIGNSYIVQDSDRFYFKDASVLWLKRTTDVRSEFINWWLKSPLFLDQLDRGNGATVDTLTIQKLQAVAVELPPLPEQHRIVAILDEAFDGIATARANAEQNLQNARALFESHLQSVFSQRGEGWSARPLSEVASIINGFAFRSGDFSADGRTKSIKITNVGVREFVESSDNGLPVDFANTYAAVAAPAGSLAIALTRTIIANGLKVAVVPESYDGALANQRVAVLIPKVDITSSDYLYADLSTSMVLNYVKERVNTLMQPNLSINDLRAMPIPLPPKSMGQTIVTNLVAIEEETQRLESIYQRKLAALDALKKSLLQKAFSGAL